MYHDNNSSHSGAGAQGHFMTAATVAGATVAVAAIVGLWNKFTYKEDK